MESYYGEIITPNMHIVLQTNITYHSASTTIRPTPTAVLVPHSAAPTPAIHSFPPIPASRQPVPYAAPTGSAPHSSPHSRTSINDDLLLDADEARVLCPSCMFIDLRMEND